LNKFLRGLIAVLGGINAVYGLFIPLAVALVIIAYFGFRHLWSFMLISAAILTTLYRAIKIGFIKD